MRQRIYYKKLKPRKNIQQEGLWIAQMIAKMSKFWKASTKTRQFWKEKVAMQWDKEPTSSSYTSQETAKSLQKFVATKAPSQKEVLKVGKKNYS